MPFTKYYGLWSSDLPLANCQRLKIQDFTGPFVFCLYFYQQYLTNSYVLSQLNIPFSARTDEIFHVYLKILPKFFTVIRRAIFYILKAITLEANMITSQITPFFSSTLWDLSFGLFQFKTFKIYFNGIPSMH